MTDLIKIAAAALGSRGGKKTAEIFGIEHYKRIQKLAAKKRKENNKKAVENSLDK